MRVRSRTRIASAGPPAHPVNILAHPMTLAPTFLASDFATAPQLAPQDMQQAAALGFRSVVNNRPDGEGGPSQPTSASLRAAAEAAGLKYAFLPVVSGHLTPADAEGLATLLKELPAPVLAFCRSGARSGVLYRAALAKR